MSTDKTSDEVLSYHSLLRRSPSRRAHAVLALVIFLFAFGVRLLSWHDTHLEVGKVQTAVTSDYRRVAELLKQGGISSFLSSSSPLSDLYNLSHPPGYSILMALIGSVFGESNTSIQIVQVICDALSAIVIFLIVAELLSASAAFVAGMLAAFSPQFALNSVLLLPDSLAVLPILLALYCLARARKNPQFVLFMVAGALVGISCWLRANAMLLTFFLAAAILILFERQKRSRYALALVCGTLLTVLPLTIRNAIVFHRFIPLSLGAGQTLLEGIADYDAQGRFNIPQTDIGIMKQESEEFHRPDYYGTLYKPDGVERERWRLARGFGVIRAHPFWFSGVMVRRAASMLRLERTRLISTDPPVSHSLEEIDKREPTWTMTAAELLSDGAVISPEAKGLLAPDGQVLLLWCDDSKYDLQLMTPFVTAQRNMDYVFAVPIKLERGRIKITVSDSQGKVLARSIVETREDKTSQEQPINLIRLPLVATADHVRLAISNEASNPPNPVAQIGTIKLFELGPARFLWTRYPRFIVHSMQKVFLTAGILPLAIVGLVLLIVARRAQALVILSVVPVYFFCVQSIVHTEYRYVLAVDYFLFALAAVSVSWIINLVIARASNLLARKS